MPDLPVEQLETNYDLLTGGVIDSLGVLRVLVWLEDTFQIPLDDAEIAPQSFRSVEAINAFIESMHTRANAICALVASLSTRTPEVTSVGALLASLRERDQLLPQRLSATANVVGTGGPPTTFNLSTAAALSPRPSAPE
jgi:acyl carrier protein